MAQPRASQPHLALLCQGRPGDIMVHSQALPHLTFAAQPQGQGPHPAAASSSSHGWLGPAVVGAAAALGAAALYTAKMTRDAERKHPPIGRFLDVDGVRLHYIERG